MHYVPRNIFMDDLVADADQLMREFNRAERALHELDQNNIKDAEVPAVSVTDPELENDSTLFTHDSTTLLQVTGSVNTTVSTTNQIWTTVETTSGVPLELAFTTSSTMWLRIFGDCTYQGATAVTYNPAIRMLVDGGMVAWSTSPMSTGVAPNTHLHVSTAVKLAPGDHAVRLQVREFLGRGGTIQGASLPLLAPQLIAFGLPR